MKIFISNTPPLSLFSEFKFVNFFLLTFSTIEIIKYTFSVFLYALFPSTNTVTFVRFRRISSWFWIRIETFPGWDMYLDTDLLPPPLPPPLLTFASHRESFRTFEHRWVFKFNLRCLSGHGQDKTNWYRLGSSTNFKGSVQSCFVLCWTNRNRAHCFVLRVSSNVSAGLLFVCIQYLLCFVYGQDQRTKEMENKNNKETGEFH